MLPHCTTRIVCREADAEKFDGFNIVSPGPEKPPAGCLVVERFGLSRPAEWPWDVPFYGYSEASDWYPPCVFARDGLGNEAEALAEGTSPMVRLNPDDLSINEADLKRAMVYSTMLAEARKAMGVKEVSA